MDDVLWFFLGFGALVALVAGPTLGLLAVLKTRRLRGEVDILRREMQRLWTRAEKWEATGPVEARPPVERAPSTVERPAPARTEASAPSLAERLAGGEPAPAPAEVGRAPEPTPELVRSAPPTFAPPPAREGAPPLPTSAPPPPKVAIDWERWIGVRGAALVGGLFLALAAIYLFKHALTSGWIAPPTRIAAGIVAGLACIGAGLRLRRRGFGWAPSALEGAGIVALYASVWAADKRYQLISIAASFPLMVLVTVLACALALRTSSLFTALLGLLGGFATPLLLSTGQDRPISLFGYLLLLDLGFLLVGQRRRWPSLGLLALLGTFLMQALWIFLRMEGRLTLGLVIVGVFALVFALAGRLAPAREPLQPGEQAGARNSWLALETLGVLFPFVFAFYFASRVELGAHVWPTALLLGLLFVSAAVTGRLHSELRVVQGVALGSVAVVAVWFLRNQRADEATLRELVAVALGLALLAHLASEWEQRARPGQTTLHQAALLAGVGWMLLLLWADASDRSEGFAPLLAGLLGLALLLVREGNLLRQGAPVVVAALGLGVGLGLFHAGYASDLGDATLPDPRVFWMLPALLAGVFLFALPRIAPAQARAANHGTCALLAAFTAIALFPLENSRDSVLFPWLPSAAGPILGGLALFAAARLSSSPWVAACVFQTAVLCIFGLVAAVDTATPLSEEMLLAVLGAMVAGPALVLVLAAFLWTHLCERRFAWAFVAALVPLAFFAVKAVYVERFGSGFEAGAHLLLCVPATFAALRLAAAGAPRGAQGWMAAAALLGATGAISDQLDHEEFAVSVALFALALAWLARRLALPAAGWTSAALAVLATVVLLAAALDAGHFTSSERLFLHWISYDYLVPAAALAGALWCSSAVPRAAGRIATLQRGAPALAVIVLLFLWVNLVIENAFSEPGLLALGSQSLPPADLHARDLTTSLAWGVFAIVLLVLGTARRTSALRWASLGLFLLAIAKVFLYDLQHLKELYRVASLAGLALSLIAVSLFYQRFVFRRASSTPVP